MHMWVSPVVTVTNAPDNNVSVGLGFDNLVYIIECVFILASFIFAPFNI